MKKINKLLVVFVIVLAFFNIFINFLSSAEKYENIAFLFKDLSIILTITIPLIFERLFKKELSEGFKLMWIIFIFMAHYLGVICALYDVWPGYDKLTHMMSGVFTAYVAMLILEGKKVKSNGFKFLFVISFVALCAVSWEIFEFVCNILVGGDAQRVALTGVDDTMLDMIVALIGGFILIVFKNIVRK